MNPLDQCNILSSTVDNVVSIVLSPYGIESYSPMYTSTSTTEIASETLLQTPRCEELTETTSQSENYVLSNDNDGVSFEADTYSLTENNVLSENNDTCFAQVLTSPSYYVSLESDFFDYNDIDEEFFVAPSEEIYTTERQIEPLDTENSGQCSASSSSFSHEVSSPEFTCSFRYKDIDEDFFIAPIDNRNTTQLETETLDTENVISISGEVLGSEFISSEQLGESGGLLEVSLDGKSTNLIENTKNRSESCSLKKNIPPLNLIKPKPKTLKSFASVCFKCHFCPAIFTDVSQLQFHLYESHSKDSTLLLVCSDVKNCEKTQHELIQICPVSNCTFSCSSTQLLHKHLDTKHKTSVYECSQCDFTCALKNRLIRHCRVAHNQKPFACKICSYVAAKPCHLDQHMHGRHLKTRLNCSFCCFSTVWKASLTKHEQRCHLRKKM